MGNQPHDKPKTAPGAAVHRGPMATDNLTQVHNLVVRGKTAIHTRYVGVWGFITSHVEGWRLTEAGIARELKVGRDFVRSALESIEAAGCLIRTQERKPNGQMGDAAWFVSDLPIQLQQLGVTDTGIVSAKVQEAYEAWRAAHFPSAAPMSENPTTGTTSENASAEQPTAADSEHLPSAAPESGYPTPAEPTPGDPTPKKTNQKNTRRKKTNQPVNEAGSAKPESTKPRDGWLAGSSSEKTSPTAGTSLLRSVGVSGKAVAEWAPTVDAALDQLGEDRTRRSLMHGTSNLTNPAGAIIKTRLPQLKEQLDAATNRTPQHRQPAKCGECDETRMRIAADGRPYRCPECNPRAMAHRDRHQPAAEAERGRVGTIGALDDLLAS